MKSIEVHPDVCNMVVLLFVIPELRFPRVLGFLSAGDSVDNILEGYPQLSREDVLACLEYAQTMTNTHSAIRLTA